MLPSGGSAVAALTTDTAAARHTTLLLLSEHEFHAPSHTPVFLRSTHLASGPLLGLRPPKKVFAGRAKRRSTEEREAKLATAQVLGRGYKILSMGTKDRLGTRGDYVTLSQSVKCTK